MFNPVIIVAIILQSFISRASRLAGAIAGYVITTGIMLWGLTVYGDGYRMAFFGIPLPVEGFVILCLVWYGFDTRELLKARKVHGKGADNKAALSDPAARDAWRATWQAWKDGQFNPAAQAEANGKAQEAFADENLKKCGRLISAAVRQRQFDSGEFIVGASMNPVHDDYVLTNRTLYLYTKDNPIPNPAIVIPLREIEEYRFETTGSGRITVKFRSGEIDHPMNAAPKAEIVYRFRDAARAMSNWSGSSAAQVDLGAVAR